MEKLPLPAPRSAVLQTLTRADTGYICGLAYGDLRGFGMAHPTIGELRYGALEVEVDYPLPGGGGWYVGEVLVTEVEGLMGTRPGRRGHRRGLRLRVRAKRNQGHRHVHPGPRAVASVWIRPPATWNSCCCTATAWR